jgi:hypothetical protein
VLKIQIDVRLRAGAPGLPVRLYDVPAKTPASASKYTAGALDATGTVQAFDSPLPVRTNRRRSPGSVS